MFLRRISNGPTPRSRARSSIAHSMAKVVCDDPYPRKPPPGIMFVYTAYPSAFLLAHRYMVSGLPSEAASVSPPWPPYAPVLETTRNWIAVSVPSRLAPSLTRVVI